MHFWLLAPSKKRARGTILCCDNFWKVASPAAHYVKQLSEALDSTEKRSECSVGSHLPVGSASTLDPETLEEIQEEESTSHEGMTKPPPHPLLPEMEDESRIAYSNHALPPRIVVVHSPTGTPPSIVFRHGSSCTGCFQGLAIWLACYFYEPLSFSCLTMIPCSRHPLGHPLEFQTSSQVLRSPCW